MLKLIIGPTSNGAKLMLDGVDVTKAMRLLSVSIPNVVRDELVQMTLTVNAEAEVELLPKGVTVIVQDPDSPAYDADDALLDDLMMHAVVKADAAYTPDSLDEIAANTCGNCGEPAKVIQGVCSVECFEQIEAGDEPVAETALKAYDGPVLKP